jgi:hypothetical protein
VVCGFRVPFFGEKIVPEIPHTSLAVPEMVIIPAATVPPAVGGGVIVIVRSPAFALPVPEDLLNTHL